MRETVPDAIFDRPTRSSLVDLPPDDLIERLREGKVYLPDQAEPGDRKLLQKGQPDRAARAGPASHGRTRQRADAGLSVAARRGTRTWPTSRTAAGVGRPQPALRPAGARCPPHGCDACERTWVAVYVETAADAAHVARPTADRIAQTLHLAEELGAETATISGSASGRRAAGLCPPPQCHAKSSSASRSATRWQEWSDGSFVYELTRKCGDIDVYVISGDFEQLARLGQSARAQLRHPLVGYLVAMAVRGGLHGRWLADARPGSPCRISSWSTCWASIAGGRAVRPRPVDPGVGLGRRGVRFLLRAAAAHLCRLRSQYLVTFAVMLTDRPGDQHADCPCRVPGRDPRGSASSAPPPCTP